MSANSANASSNASNISVNSTNISANSSNISVNSSNISAVSSQASAVSSQATASASSTAATSSRLATVDSFVITPDEAAAVPGQNPQSLKQRLRITVPHLNTSLTMGSGAVEGQLRTDDPNKQLHWPGFGVTTEGNVYLEAVGPAASSRIKLQTNGDITVHSNENGVNVGGKGGVTVATDMGATVVGNGGVMIAGGTMGIGSICVGLDEPDGGQNPQTPGWVSNLGKVASYIGAGLLAFDAGLAATMLIRDRKNIAAGFSDVKHNKAKVAATLASVAGGLFSAGGVYYNVAGATGGPTAGAQIFAGTTIYAQSGLVLGSTTTAGLYSVMGTTIYSPASVSVWSNGYVGITAGLDFSIATKKGEINADDVLIMRGGSTAVLGSDKNTDISANEFATLAGGVLGLVTGQYAAVQADKGAFVEAENVDIQAHAAAVTIQAKTEGSFSVSDGPLGLSSKGGPVSISSPKNVHVTSGDFVLFVEPSQLYLGRGSKSAGDPPVKPPPKATVLDGVGKRPNNKFKSPEYLAWKATKEKALSDWKTASTQFAKDKKAYDLKVAGIKDGDVGMTMKSGNIEIKVKGFSFKVDSSKVKSGAIEWKKA